MAIVLTRIIQKIADETYENVKEEKKVRPQTLEELARAIKNLSESSEEVTQIDRTNIEKAIECLTAVESMISNIKKETEKELEEGAREEVIAKIAYVPVKQMIEDLRKFLLGKRVEKTYKPRTK